MEAEGHTTPRDTELTSPKRSKLITQEGTTSIPAIPGTTGASSSAAQMAADESMDSAIGVIAAVANGEEIAMKPEKHVSQEDAMRYEKWMNQHKELFETETVANTMDYSDTLGCDEKDLLRARKEELRKLNEELGAFTPRDGPELSRDIVIFGHKWVDKVTEGRAKARLTCQDCKKRGTPEDKNSPETPSKFCPTPHGSTWMFSENPRDLHLASAFLIASDQGDDKGQPVMMRPPSEWLDDYEDWFAMQPKELQEELRDIPKESIVWQVDGNLYGRQSAAAQYRDLLEEIITNKLPKEKYNFQRGKLDACVYRCTKTETSYSSHR